MLLVIGLKKYSPSGSDSETISPKRVLMPRWPVSTTLMPQPATLTTMTATIAMPAQMRIVRIGSGSPRRHRRCCRREKSVMLKAMNFLPC